MSWTGSECGWGGVVLCLQMKLFRFVTCHLSLKMCRCLTSSCRRLQRHHHPCLSLWVMWNCSSKGCEVQSVSCMELTLKLDCATWNVNGSDYFKKNGDSASSSWIYFLLGKDKVWKRKCLTSVPLSNSLKSSTNQDRWRKCVVGRLWVSSLADFCLLAYWLLRCQKCVMFSSPSFPQLAINLLFFCTAGCKEYWNLDNVKCFEFGSIRK